MFGEEIKTIRKTLGYTQATVSKKTGIPQNTISWIEANKGIANIQQCKLLADFYEVSLDELIEGEIQSNKNAKKNTADKLSADEKKLLETYRALNTKNKMHVSVYADVRLEEQEERLKNGGIFDM